MPNAARPTFSELVDSIKIESRVKGADNLDVFIGTLINELLLDYAQKNRYFEFLVTNAQVATLQQTDRYSLPADYMNMRLVRYRQDSNGSGYTRTLHPRSQYVDTARGWLPRWYELAGNEVVIFPIEDMPSGDTLLLDYHKIPDTLSGNIPFPIPRLVPTIKLEAIHRVLIYNNQLPQAAALRGEATENEVRSKPAG